MGKTRVEHRSPDLKSRVLSAPYHAGFLVDIEKQYTRFVCKEDFKEKKSVLKTLVFT